MWKSCSEMKVWQMPVTRCLVLNPTVRICRPISQSTAAVIVRIATFFVRTVLSQATFCCHSTEFWYDLIPFSWSASSKYTYQTWTGSFFQRSNFNLKELGLRVQLGHQAGTPCCQPIAAFDNSFTVIDSDGIHEISLDYCGCQQSLPLTTQLLRAQLFPATTSSPKTAATFQVLETFHLLTLVSKISCFEFYKSIKRRTDNTGTSQPPVCSSNLFIQMLFKPTLGPIPYFTLDHARMAPCANAEAVWPWPCEGGCEGNKGGRMCGSLPRMPSSRDKSPR